jgi:hypothetical protein
MTGLTNLEITKIVNRYIGVGVTSAGYLGDFTYPSHTDFYPVYCELDIDPKKYEGNTTRERFITILKSSSAHDQAKILRGVLERFPLDSLYAKPETRTKELYEELLNIAQRLEGTSTVSSPEPQITSTVVERAIADGELLIQSGDAVSGVDRIHTALHGYLLAVCKAEEIVSGKDESMTKLFKSLRNNHPAFRDSGTHSEDINRILQAFAIIMDALNPIRNRGSVAHPNDELLNKEEAMLVINVARTLLHYLDSKLMKQST